MNNNTLWLTLDSPGVTISIPELLHDLVKDRVMVEKGMPSSLDSQKLTQLSEAMLSGLANLAEVCKHYGLPDVEQAFWEIGINIKN